MEDLLIARCHGADQQPGGRHNRDPSKFFALHLEQHDRGQNQRNRGKHLVRNAKQWPQGVDAAKRIHHALIQEITPGTDTQQCGEDVRRQIGHCTERGYQSAQQVLQHEAADASACIHSSQDE